jgi:hypothetical protein
MKTFKLIYADCPLARARASHVVSYRPTHDIRRSVEPDLRMPGRVSATIWLPASFSAPRFGAVLRVPLRAVPFLGNALQTALHRRGARSYSIRHGCADVSGDHDRYVPAKQVESHGNYASPPRSSSVVGDHNEPQGGNR